jgi:CubicO group peptidase (beta-lactamase class C family)
MQNVNIRRHIDKDGVRLPQNLTISSFLIIVVALFFSASGAAQSVSQAATASVSPAQNAARLKAIEKAVEARRLELGVPGLSLAIVTQDQIIFSKGFGLRDTARKLPVTPDTLFAIGSTTKAFTAMATVMSADQGKLSLEDSPKRFLPFFKLRDAEADSAVTIRDLLCHRTGLDRTDFSLQFAESLTREELIRIAGLAKPTAKFRTRFQYQNMMYVAAGEAAAKANGISWEKLIENRIFSPLGMSRSTISLEAMKNSGNFSLGYEYDPEAKEAKNLQMINLGKIAPAGAINSSAGDMAKWLRLLLADGKFEGRRLVSEKNFAELFAQQIQVAPKVGYGLGWFVREWRGKKTLEHAGNIDGFNAVVMLLPEEKMGLVLLTNVTNSPLTNEVRDIVFSNLSGESLTGKAAGEEAKSAAPPENISKAADQNKISKSDIPAAMIEMLGSYETEPKGTPIDIIFANNSVSFVVQAQPPRRLTEKSSGIFAIEGLPENYTLEVKRDQTGKIKNLVFNQRDGAAVLRSVSLPPNAPLVEELMQKVIEAAGGEAVLRKHSSMQMKGTINLEYEGITGEVSVSAKAPNLTASRVKYLALGKQIGETLNYFDGKIGGSYTRDNISIVGTPRAPRGEFFEDARIAADFYQILNWKTLYRTVELQRVSRIAGEDVYVIVKTPVAGHPVTEYISQKSFLVLRRETAQPGGGTQAVPYVDNFSDFRKIDGAVVPFRIDSGIPNYRMTTVIVDSVRFNAPVPDSDFRPEADMIGLQQ